MGMCAPRVEAREAYQSVGWGRQRGRTKAQIRMFGSLKRGGIDVGEAGTRSPDAWAPASWSKDGGFKD